MLLILLNCLNCRVFSERLTLNWCFVVAHWDSRASALLFPRSRFHTWTPDCVRRIRPRLCPELPFHTCSTHQAVRVRCILTCWKYFVLCPGVYTGWSAQETTLDAVTEPVCNLNINSQISCCSLHSYGNSGTSSWISLCLYFDIFIGVFIVNGLSFFTIGCLCSSCFVPVTW